MNKPNRPWPASFTKTSTVRFFFSPFAIEKLLQAETDPLLTIAACDVEIFIPPSSAEFPSGSFGILII